MKISDFNLFKLKHRVNINSIQMFHACLEYNAKSHPIINLELVKWPMYLQYWKRLKKEKRILNFKVKSKKDKLNLSCDFIQSPEINRNNSKTVFILHGLTNTRYWLFKQAYIFLKQGYNIVWYDARNHGETDSGPMTFGSREAHDLQDVIDYTITELGLKEMYLYGFSLGAATILMWSKFCQKYENNKLIKGIICDSSFAKLDDAYREKMGNHTFMPNHWILSFFLWQMKRDLETVDLKKLRPIKHLKEIAHIPALFVHGKLDNFISYTHSEALYHEKVKHEKEIISKLYLVDGASHGQCFLVGDHDPDILDAYKCNHKISISELVINFLDGIEKNSAF